MTPKTLCHQDYSTIAEFREWLAIFHKDKIPEFDTFSDEDKLYVAESALRIKEQIAFLGKRRNDA